MRRDISPTLGKVSCDPGGMGELCVVTLLSLIDAIPGKGGCDGSSSNLFFENEARKGR
jgi:hypothetical protein